MLLEALFACSLSAAAALPPQSVLTTVQNPAAQSPTALCGDEDETEEPKPEEPSVLCGDEDETEEPKPEEPSSF